MWLFLQLEVSMARKMPLSSKSLIVYFLDERRSKVLYPMHVASVCYSSLVSPTTFRELRATGSHTQHC